MGELALVLAVLAALAVLVVVVWALSVRSAIHDHDLRAAYRAVEVAAHVDHGRAQQRSIVEQHRREVGGLTRE